MGVDATAYLVYGVKLPYIEDIYEHDELLPYIEGHEGIKYRIIHDGMCGKYTVFGKVLSEINYYSGDIYFENIEIDKQDETEWYDKFYELFNGIIEYANVKPKIFMFLHYS